MNAVTPEPKLKPILLSIMIANIPIIEATNTPEIIPEFFSFNT